MNILITLLLSFAFLNCVFAEQNTPKEQRIELKSGSILKGYISHQNENNLTITTTDGITINVERDRIVSIQSTKDYLNFTFFDPKSTRLLFSPTGRALKKGKSYFTDFYVFLPSYSYGFTDQFSVMAGMSILPGVGFSEQIKYIAPRYTFQESSKSASSIGILNVFADGDNSAGIFYASHTIGKPDKSFTAAIGWGYVKTDSEELNVHEYPIIMLGGNIRLSKHTAFVTENWIITNVSYRVYPFIAGLRFFNKKMAVDVGGMFIKEILDEGFPIPWLSFSYHFE